MSIKCLKKVTEKYEQECPAVAADYMKLLLCAF
jgi:hypothetical protein